MKLLKQLPEHTFIHWENRQQDSEQNRISKLALLQFLLSHLKCYSVISQEFWILFYSFLFLTACIQEKPASRFSKMEWVGWGEWDVWNWDKPHDRAGDWEYDKLQGVRQWPMHDRQKMGFLKRPWTDKKKNNETGIGELPTAISPHFAGQNFCTLLKLRVRCVARTSMRKNVVLRGSKGTKGREGNHLSSFLSRLTEVCP